MAQNPRFKKLKLFLRKAFGVAHTSSIIAGLIIMRIGGCPLNTIEPDLITGRVVLRLSWLPVWRQNSGVDLV